MRFEPKSGCRCTERPTLRTQAAECGLSGAWLMSLRHGLSAGNSAHPAIRGTGQPQRGSRVRLAATQRMDARDATTR